MRGIQGRASYPDQDRYPAPLHRQVDQPGPFLGLQRRVFTGSREEHDAVHAGGAQAIQDLENRAEIDFFLPSAGCDGSHVHSTHLHDGRGGASWGSL